MNDASQVQRLDVRGVSSFVRVGPRSISLGRDEDVLNWDRAGRPFAGNLDGITWHRALDGRLVRIDSEPGGARRASWLSWDETSRWSETIRGWAAAVPEAARAAGRDDTAQAFEPAATFGAERWASDASGFADVYAPVPILPPDQDLALVLQATLGCAWNRCTF